MDTHQPPLPVEEPLRTSEPPLPPTEPLSHPRPSKRLGIGNADGSKLNTGPPSKKSRKTKEANGLGIRPPIGVTAEELQALEDGELEDSDDNCSVKDTYFVIDKKAKKKSPGHDVKRRESMEFEQPSSGAVGLPELAVPVVKKEIILPEVAVESDVMKKDEQEGLSGQAAEENVNGDFMSFEEDVPLEEEENDDTENPEIAEKLEEFFDDTLVNAQEFAVIDDISQSDQENEGNGVEQGASAGPVLEDDYNTGEDFESDSMDEEEIEAMLDADFEKRRLEERPEDKFMVREKMVLLEKGVDPFDILPEGWVQVTHNSGMPIYLNQKSRVCTLCKPYFLGPGSAKKHNIPMSAIPCLQYRKALNEECDATRPGDNVSSENPVCDDKSQSDPEKPGQVPEQGGKAGLEIDKETPLDKGELETEGQKTCPLSADQQIINTEAEESKEEQKQSDVAVNEEKEDKKEDTTGEAEAPKAEKDKQSTTTNEEKPQTTEEKKPEENKSAAMILKLEQDLTQLAALTEGSPSASGTPSPEVTAAVAAEVTAGVTAEVTAGVPAEEGSNKQTTEEEDLELIAAKMIESSMQQDAEKVEAIVRRTSLQEHTTSEEPMETDSQDQTEKSATTEDQPKSENAEEMPVCNVKIMSVEDYKEQKCLKWDQVHEYCTKLFQFKKVYVKRFKTWKARRAHERHHQKPSLPEGTRLLRCSVAVPQTKLGNDPTTRKKEFTLNPKGKSDVCILHEYAQHTMRIQPKYIFEDSDNALTPFHATILIHNIRYGTGTAASKKAAKAEAATETLKILIPEFLKLREKENPLEASGDLSFFNEIKVEDPRVPELSAKAGQPLPYEILNTCLKRNYGLGDTNISSGMEIIRPKKSEFTMKVGKYEAKVACKNKREGKQKAAQVLLQKMHPHISCWGSLLRLYARNVSILKEKKAQKDSITCLQGKVSAEPNTAILNKLREEMQKLQKKRAQVEANIKGRIEMPAIELKSSELGHVDLH